MMRSKVLNIIKLFFPYSVFLTILFLGIGLYYSLFLSPADYQQGDTVRIMYIHVPSAYISMLSYLMLTAFSIFYLVWNNSLSIIFAKSIAPIGMVFTFICLVTGSIWGAPTWGSWWVWDARLTSMLILFFIYCTYMAISNSFSYERANKVSSIFAIVGAINLPIIKFSVDWWNTLHQPASIFKLGGPSIDSLMLKPLIIMLIGFLFLFLTIFMMSIKYNYIKKRLSSLNKIY